MFPVESIPDQGLTVGIFDLLLDSVRGRARARAAVQVAIEDTLDQGLPDVYDRTLFSRKSAAVFEHVFSAYQGDGRSIYEEAA